MSQEIEIEYKVLLTKSQYDRLSNELPFPKAVTQVNYYFETKDFALKAHRSALRIRKKGNDFVLTLKEPHAEGILETHDVLTEEEFIQWKNGNPIAKPHTNKRFHKMGISVEQLRYYGALTTERKMFSEQNIDYFLDKSYYNKIVDYELEMEAPTQELGMKAFQTILHKYGIEKQTPITKIERFFYSLKK